MDGRDDLERAAAAVRAALHVDVKDALVQPRPADAVRPCLDGLDSARQSDIAKFSSQHGWRATSRWPFSFPGWLAVADRDVLRAAVEVLDQAAVSLGLAGVQGLLQRVDTKSVCIELRTRQATMRRANTSMTKATNSQPCQGGT